MGNHRHRSRSQPLRSNAGSRKIAGRKVKTKRPEKTPEEWFPEIVALPFVKYLGESPKHGRRLDYWAVEGKAPDDGIDGELLGRYYALLTAQFIHEDSKRDRPSILPRIIAAIVKKGKFWGGLKGDKHDEIAVGFACCIGQIMGWAHASGTIRSMAVAVSNHYAKHAKVARPRDTRELLERYSKLYRDFALPDGPRPWEHKQGGRS
jgi:hypothetical protein